MIGLLDMILDSYSLDPCTAFLGEPNTFYNIVADAEPKGNFWEITIDKAQQIKTWSNKLWSK